MARERQRVPIEEIIEPYREAPEEVEERYVFTFFFGFIAVIIILVAAGLIVDQLVKVTNGAIKMEFFAFVGACMGIIVCGLTIFDVYWSDRYLVLTIGLLMAIGFALWGVFSSQELSNLLKGGILMFVALMLVGIVSMINVFGWVRLRAHRYSTFALLVLLNIIFLVVAAWIAVEFPASR